MHSVWMVRGVAMAVLCALVGSHAGCRSAEIGDEPVAAEDRRAPVEIIDPDILPQGAVLRVRLEEGIDIETAREGDEFVATVIDEVRSSTGEVVVPAEALISGRVTAVGAADVAGEAAVIKLGFEALHIGARSYPLRAQIVGAEIDDGRARRDVAIGSRLGGVFDAVSGTAIGLGRDAVGAVIRPGSRMVLRTTRELIIDGAA